MNCTCLTEINEKLKPENLQISGIAWQLPSFKTIVVIETAWLDQSLAPKGRKKNPPKMYASHCPFCGVAIEAKTSDSCKSSAN